MVTDRVSTCGLLMILGGIYRDYELFFVFLAVLDIGSHWFHVARCVVVCGLICLYMC